MSLHRSLSRAARFLGIAILPCIARAGVLVVDPSGSPYANLFEAEQAAADGDVILIRSGAQVGSVMIQDKALTIVAEPGAQLGLADIYIYGLSASKQVTIAGLRSANPSGGVECVTCDGAIRIIDSTFGGGTVFLTYPPNPTVFIYDCADVSFHGCRIEAVEESQHGGSVGVLVKDSVVSMWNTIVRGGRGPEGSPWYDTNQPNGPGGQGIPAIVSDSSLLYFSACRITGGQGGPGFDGQCGHPLDVASPGGLGGGALGVFDGPTGITSHFRLLDTFAHGGAGGPGGSNECESAPDGEGLGPVSGGSIVEILLGDARSMSPIAVASEGQSIHLKFSGQPGDRAYLGVAARWGYTYVAAMNGPLLLADAPLRSKFIGVLDARGFLEANIPVTELGPGVEAILRHAQGLLVGADGSTWVTGGSPMVRLDSAF